MCACGGLTPPLVGGKERSGGPTRTAVPLQSNEEGLVLISEALKASGHADKVKIAMDCAASEFCGE